jgi:hypothetical protein
MTLVTHGRDQSGTTAQRPDLGAEEAGFVYFDTTLGIPVTWSGSAWSIGTAMALATYDFAVNGGLIGTIGLGVVVPAKAIIWDGFVDVLTTFESDDSDAGTVALQVEAANDIITAIAISNGTDPWDAGLKNVKSVGTAATAVKTTVARQVSLVVAVENLLAGKLVVGLRYHVTA